MSQQHAQKSAQPTTCFSLSVSPVSFNKPIWKPSRQQNAVTNMCIVHNPFPLSPCSIA